MTHWLTVNCSTNWAIFPRYLIKLATWKGLEPSTSSVTGWHSNQLNYQAANGGTNRARTCDPLLVRQVLSQLSYSPISLIWSGWRGSNPHSRLGRPELYHWATPAWWLIGESNPCYRRERAVSWPLDQWAIMVIHPRLERGTPWLKVRCSTDWANGSSYVSDFIEFLRISLAHKDYYISFCILSQHFYYNFLYFFQ